MTEYIRKEAVLALTRQHTSPFPMAAPIPMIHPEDVKALPAEEVAIVRHAHWERTKVRSWCSACNKHTEEETEYCGRCGAIMDEPIKGLEMSYEEN